MPMTCETAALQCKSELLAFIELLRKEGVKSYLEIGGKYGGSLWPIANAMPKGSRVVCVDLPQGDTLRHLQECIEALKRKQYDTHLIIGGSTDADVIKKVAALGPFDLCLIDANHTLPFVTKDFETYGTMCRIVAFHDIGFWRKDPLPKHKIPIEVPQLWNVIKKDFRHVEIRHDKQDNGIGVLWV